MPRAKRPTPPAKPNVLLVTLDTTRADRVGAYGYVAAATPNLDRLAAEGVRFDQALSSVPLTLPSHASLLVVVAGDHGESLGDHGESTHGLFVYESALRVPLIMAGAGISAAWVVTEPVRLIDVAPGSGIRDQGSGVRDQGSGVRDQGSGIGDQSIERSP